MYQKRFDHKRQIQYGNFMLHFTLEGKLLHVFCQMQILYQEKMMK